MLKKTIKQKNETTKVAKPVHSAKHVGRPNGSGKFGCPTKAVRLPVHLIDDVQAFVMRTLKKKTT